MKINNRLKKISEFINNNSFILDVGCDHALLDIYLVLNKENIKAIASDVREKPLIKAYENLKKYGLENSNKIILEQKDGIENLNNEISTIVISGMGAITILKILNDNFDKITNQQLIISPNNEEELIRKYLYKKGFMITNEVLVEDKNIIYPIIVFEKGISKLSKKEINYGPILLKNKNNLYKKYYQEKIDNLLKIKTNLPKKYFITKINLNKKIREIKSVL